MCTHRLVDKKKEPGASAFGSLVVLVEMHGLLPRPNGFFISIKPERRGKASVQIVDLIDRSIRDGSVCMKGCQKLR
jgi:hypothetical protein